MDSIREFSVGDWIVNEDGICQVLASQKYVVEDFFAKDYPDKAIGEVFENKLVCKILCDFEPKPRKTRFIKSYSSAWCEPLDKKYDALKKQIQTEHPEQYKKFQNVSIQKPVTANVDFSFRVNPNEKTRIIDELNDLLLSKVNGMTFENVEKLIYGSVKGIESSSLVFKDKLRTNVLISLTYEVTGAMENKFCFIGGKAFSVYCDEE